MGLVLDPEEIRTMSLDIVSALTKDNDELEQVLAPVKGFVNEDKLQGIAYSSLKSHMQDHLTVIHGLISANETVINKIKSIMNVVGEEKLVEDELNDTIRAFRQLICEYNNQINYYSNLLRNELYVGMFSTYALYQIRSFQMGIDYAESTISQANKKINKLYEINHLISQILTDVYSIYDDANSGIESLNNDWNGAGYNMPPKDALWRAHLQTMWNESTQTAFINNMNEQFGFSKEDAELLYDLYEKLMINDPETADEEYIKLIASVHYNGIAWFVPIGLRSEDVVRSRMMGNGCKENETGRIIAAINAQHLECNNRNTVDLVHMCATIEANYSKSKMKQIGNAAGAFNGIFSFEKNAGYIGDICGTNNTPPLMEKADYKADLDAVNLYNRLENNNNGVICTMNEYYNELKSGKTNRAKEFKNNVGYDSLERDRSLYNEYLCQLYGEPVAGTNIELLDESMPDYHCYRERMELYDKFVNAINNDQNEIKEDLIWIK